MSPALEKALMTGLLCNFAEVWAPHIHQTVLLSIKLNENNFSVIILPWAYSCDYSPYWFSQIGTGFRLYTEVLNHLPTFLKHRKRKQLVVHVEGIICIYIYEYMYIHTYTKIKKGCLQMLHEYRILSLGIDSHGISPLLSSYLLPLLGYSEPVF